MKKLILTIALASFVSASGTHSANAALISSVPISPEVESGGDGEKVLIFALLMGLAFYLSGGSGAAASTKAPAKKADQPEKGDVLMKF